MAQRRPTVWPPTFGKDAKLLNRKLYAGSPLTLLLVFAILASLTPLALTPRTAYSQETGPSITLEPIATGLDRPDYVADPGDGSNRLFILEQGGVIHIVEDGELLPEPFLDFSSEVTSVSAESGAVGLVFHPNYEENGYFYVTYSPTKDSWAMARYQVSDDPNVADPESGQVMIEAPDPDRVHWGGHYAGMMTFKDGYLYVSIGDGGGDYDPDHHAQDLTSLLGKILRLDVDGNFPYAIPPDNPFVEDENARPEIWAYGLRNPSRYSFDRETGDLYIGDVGQLDWEEIDFQPEGEGAGANYGWPLLEGPECSVAHPDCDPEAYTPPVYAYGHEEGCAVTGGYVYRGNPDSPLYGAYLFSDYCSGVIWSLERDESGEWQRTALLETGLSIGSFGEDAAGNLYVAALEGGVYRLDFSAGAQTPAITSVAPDAIPAGSVVCAVTINGVNITSETVATWNGESRPVEQVDENSLLVFPTSDDVAEPGVATVQIENPTLGEGPSNTVEIELQDGYIADRAIYNTWARTDLPVDQGAADRTWMWGPTGKTCAMLEPYAEAPDGFRAVQYFDKSRMEVTSPAADTASPWYVTNGLLVVEMVTGQLQLGHDTFEEREPATLNVAGDPEGQNGPTYATFNALTGPVDDRGEAVITEQVNRAGEVTADPVLEGQSVTTTHFDPITGHNIAAPFWEFMNSNGTVWDPSGPEGTPSGGQITEASLFPDPVFATGRPITEPYWASIPVAGTEQLVLIQCFERRCLTYTPASDPGWQVEAGNVGQHYYEWRYGAE